MMHETFYAGSKLIIKFLPESWYGNRVVLSVGFSLGSSYSDKVRARQLSWWRSIGRQVTLYLYSE